MPATVENLVVGTLEGHVVTAALKLPAPVGCGKGVIPGNHLRRSNLGAAAEAADTEFRGDVAVGVIGQRQGGLLVTGFVGHDELLGGGLKVFLFKEVNPFLGHKAACEIEVGFHELDAELAGGMGEGKEGIVIKHVHLSEQGEEDGADVQVLEAAAVLAQG